jgi:hypothetical protein
LQLKNGLEKDENITWAVKRARGKSWKDRFNERRKI